MAWRSHGATNEELVDNLRQNGVFSSERVASVMKKVNRANFCSQSPYQDAPQSIGYSVTISAPHMHASALQLLQNHLKPGNRCLDVGCGSGYLTACMALMVSPDGKAIGIDHIHELVEFSRRNIQKDQPQLLSSGVAELIVGDGREGYEAAGPYDAIHVGAAASDLPQKLLDQLKPGGRMIIPVGTQGYNQMLEQIDKLPNGEIKREKLIGVVYVPLTDRNLQCPTK